MGSTDLSTSGKLEAAKALMSADSADKDGGGGDDKEPSSNAAKMLEIAGDGELIKTPRDGAFLLLRNKRPLSLDERGGDARKYIRKEFYERYGKPPRENDLGDVIRLLIALADNRRDIHTRVAANDERVVIDLAQDNNKAVVITAKDIHITDTHGLLFRKIDGLTTPMAEPNLDCEAVDVFNRYNELLGLPLEESFKSMCWLVQCLQPAAPFLIINRGGAAGTGKTTVAATERLIIDPLGSDGRQFCQSPSSVTDLLAAAKLSHVLAIDNSTHFNKELSDCIAGLASRMSYIVREYYTNSDPHSIEKMMPVSINGLCPTGLKPDVKDRMLTSNYHTRDCFKSSRQYWREADNLLDDMRGAIYQAVRFALEALQYVEDIGAYRMADALRFIAAAEPFLTQAGSPWQGLSFLDIYHDSRQTAAADALEGDVLTETLVLLIRSNGELRGTASALLDEIKIAAGDDLHKVEKSPGWPKSVSSFSRKLTRIAPLLRDAGIEYFKDGQRTHCLRILEEC